MADPVPDPIAPADPDSLRERYAAAVYAHEYPRGAPWPDAFAMDREVFLAHADVVLAVRDEELERLRTELARVEAAGNVHLAAADKLRAEVQRDRDQHAAVLAAVLSQFVHKGHPGEPCLQTGWISEETVAKWRAVVAPTAEEPWWQQIDHLREQLAEARMWARHGYEIGQRSCTWSDFGVAPAWLTEGADRA